MAGTYRGRTEIFRFLARLPKLTGGTYRSTVIDALASEERGAGSTAPTASAKAGRSTSTSCSSSRSATGS